MNYVAIWAANVAHYRLVPDIHGDPRKGPLFLSIEPNPTEHPLP
jgi:hypothetical protein